MTRRFLGKKGFGMAIPSRAKSEYNLKRKEE
jgi:hypothetical protein